MKKKILALILALVMCFSVPTAVTASAAANNTTAGGAFPSLKKFSEGLLEMMQPYLKNIVLAGESKEQLLASGEALMAEYMSGLLSADDTEETDGIIAASNKPLQYAAPAALTEDAEGASFEIKAGSLSELLGKYVFVKLDNDAALAALIAENSDMTYHTINGSDGTLYISVNIENNPEIFNSVVFRQVVEALYARQGEEMLTDRYGKIDYVMSYEHIAGELAMHMLVFAAVNEIMHLTNTKDERLVNLYHSSAIADLNIDEDRVPAGFISAFGTLVINFVKFSAFILFGVK